MLASMTDGTLTADPQLIEQLRDSAVDYCKGALPWRRLRDLHAGGASFDRARWREIAELGWAGIVVADGRGGLNLGAAAVAAIGRELGRVVAPEPFIETAVASAALLTALDSDDYRLQALLQGEAVFTCPLRRSAWSGHAGLEATMAGADFVLHGHLDHVPLAPDADYLLVPASCAGRLAVFAVPRHAAGLTVLPRVLADGSRDGRLEFDRVRSDAAQNLAAAGSDVLEAADYALSLAGIGASAYLLGACESLLTMTLDYLRTRRQFGRALGTFQALQHRMVDLYLQNRLTAAALSAALSACDAQHGVAIATARVRQRACETALTASREAIQMHGAIGYTEQCDVSLFVQRALVMNARFGGALSELHELRDFAMGGAGVSAAEAVTENLPATAMAADHDWNALDDRTFRQTVRRWVEANYPPELRHVPGQLRWAEIRDWHLRLVERGWAAPAWPVEFGGMGLAPSKMLIFIEELECWGVARAPDQGIVMLGPILFEYGTPEQRAQYLPGALSGEQIWCQGYSEPNAGSDLASLATSAVLAGDEFIVNGQKTWTTHGLDATHMYCLVRTDAQVKPQAGISFLLIDLDQPGVTVRPIRNLGGHVDFCEVFLDDVRVPRANLVGPLNQGWTIAKSLLGHERLFVGSPKLCQHALHQLRELGQASGQTRDPVFMDALTRMTLDVLDLEALYAEFAAIVKQGGALGADVAVLKIWSTETYVRLSEMIVRVAGPAGAVQGRSDFGGAAIDVLSHYYNARPAPIYAGSNEIQRNIVARHVLDLPT